ncbi:hypothetical protein DERP_006480 [Dermatophagoides pteronyssinus]|uniref:Uncharacterized protein n=1 Tax=Dermatophagoides pteronyssinus TaxID=6956 RepID=A0ABQ8IQA6_DERPT|nr:hypothetical protein DERP_006480 [Dermatophagoides pteronyssinus]
MFKYCLITSFGSLIFVSPVIIIIISSHDTNEKFDPYKLSLADRFCINTNDCATQDILSLTNVKKEKRRNLT